MIELVARYVLPAAYAVLPAPMSSPAASAMLLAIGLQESSFRARQQIHGPARSFWMFELAGIRGLLADAHTVGPIYEAVATLGYPPARTLLAADFLEAIQHNDVLAAVFARCLLWTHADALPAPDQAEAGWQQYVDLWRPGKPRPKEWAAYYGDAWNRVGTDWE